MILFLLYHHRDCSLWPARPPVHTNGKAPNSPSNQTSSVDSDVVIEDPVRDWIDAQRLQEQKFASTFNNMHLYQVSYEHSERLHLECCNFVFHCMHRHRMVRTALKTRWIDDAISRREFVTTHRTASKQVNITQSLLFSHRKLVSTQQ